MDYLEQLTDEELFATAQYDSSREDLSAALIKFKVLIARDSSPLETHAAIAKIYARLRLFDSAKTHFETFLASEPDAVVEQFQLGLVNLDMGDRDSAIAIWDSVLGKAPGFPPVLYHKALVFAREGESQAALNLLQELFANASSDNFYFTKGKELSDAIRQSAPAMPSHDESDNQQIVDQVYGPGAESKKLN